MSERRTNSGSMSGARRAHNESTDVASAAIGIMIVVPALMLICALIAMIFDGWRAGLGQ